MLAAGVPCVPGWHPSSTSPASTQLPENLLQEADKIGYPVLIKAVSGGGGKGMKIVDKREDFIDQLESAKREARKSFGDDVVRRLPPNRCCRRYLNVVLIIRSCWKNICRLPDVCFFLFRQVNILIADF